MFCLLVLLVNKLDDLLLKTQNQQTADLEQVRSSPFDACPSPQTFDWPASTGPMRQRCSAHLQNVFGGKARHMCKNGKTPDQSSSPCT